MEEEIGYSEEALELIETMTNKVGGERKVIAVPSCPTCKSPGAFFKLYGVEEKSEKKEVIVID